MIVFVSAEAAADLERIGDFIALDNPARAASFVVELLEVCERLVDAPLGYALVPRYEKSGIRRRSFRNYLIFYRISGERIDILHILNGARDYESILFPTTR